MHIWFNKKNIFMAKTLIYLQLSINKKEKLLCNNQFLLNTFRIF